MRNIITTETNQSRIRGDRLKLIKYSKSNRVALGCCDKAFCKLLNYTKLISTDYRQNRAGIKFLCSWRIKMYPSKGVSLRFSFMAGLLVDSLYSYICSFKTKCLPGSYLYLLRKGEIDALV
jgi:hypothetical protein